MGLSQDLLDAHGPSWKALTGHEFFRKVERGVLTEASRNAYFRYERAFVDQAVVVFSYILAGATALQARRRLISVLSGLVHEQIDVFDDIFLRCGLQGQSHQTARWPAPVEALCDGMTDIARSGEYAAGLSAMFVAERSYLEVSRRICNANISDRALNEWFQIHTQRDFSTSVQWIAQEIDSLGEQGVSIDRVAPAFSRAIDLEIEFHRAPLGI